MKRRYLLTSFLFITFVAMTTFFVTSFYFAQERMRLIGQQIETVAAGLLANDFNDIELAQMDTIVAKSLLAQPRSVIINIFNPQHRVIYQNNNALVFLHDNIPSPTFHLFFTYETHSHRFRFLNLPIASHFTLQIGMILDQQQIYFVKMNLRILLLMGLILLCALLLSWLQAKILFRPLAEIATYINVLAGHLENNISEHRPFSKKLQKILLNDNDREIKLLLDSLNYFRHAVEKKIQLAQTTMAQMAHELKTPLTIIRNSFEFLKLRKTTDIEEQNEIITEAIDEVDHLNTIIGRFLEWSRFESYGKKTDLRPINLVILLEELLALINKLFPHHHYNFTFQRQIQVLADQEDLRQLLTNLIENAFKYTSNEMIQIDLRDQGLAISNASLPIPTEILLNIGEPFNSGKIQGIQSIGLGLAWVSSICKHYQWKFSLSHYEGNTQAIVQFPTLNN